MPRCATALNFVIPSVVIPSVSRGTRDLLCALPSNNSLQLRPSISTNAKVGRRPKICRPDRSVAQRRDLRFHFRQKRMCRGRIASRFRFSIKANRRSLGYARDDKVEGGGPPWHEWRWMDRVGKKANLDKSG